MELTIPMKTLQNDGGTHVRITCVQDGSEIEAAGQSPNVVPVGANSVFEVAHPASLQVGPQLIPGPARTKIVVRVYDDRTKIDVVGQKPIPLETGKPWTSSPNPSELVVWACSCGNINCQRRHRLESWDPANRDVKLWSFAASAVKGPKRTIGTGSMAQGIYFPLLAREGFETGRLRSAPVESKVCRCGKADNQGSRCSKCRGELSPLETRKLEKSRLIVVASVPPVYDRQEHSKCNQWAAHYQKYHPGTTLPDKLGKEWDNLYEINLDDLEQFKAGRKLLKTDRDLEVTANARKVTVQRLRSELEARCSGLRERLTCPLCGSLPSSLRESHVWVRCRPLREKTYTWPRSDR